MLGLLHEDGRTVAPDQNIALEFYRAGAAQGDCWAHLNAARILVAKGSHGDAFDLLERSVSFGFPDFWIDAVPSVEHSPNIYIDTAYNMVSSIEGAIRQFGAERVLFSTDSPYLSLDNEVKKLQALQITEEQRRKVGCENMQAILERAGC